MVGQIAWNNGYLFDSFDNMSVRIPGKKNFLYDAVIIIYIIVIVIVYNGGNKFTFKYIDQCPD